MNRIISIFALSVCFGFAQDVGAIRLKIVKSAPFSAQVQTESIQILRDDNHVKHTSSATVARDSEGRTRREQVGSGIVFLSDPLLSSAYVLDARTKTARKYALPFAEADGVEKSASPDVKREELGTNVIEGLPASGMRLTRTIADGEAGNERSFDVTSEAWYSVDLQIVLSSRTLDPRTGESIYKLTNINRAEPDHLLFEIPAGYTIQETVSK